ncbi:MAG: molybdopterin-dependent oxidoreductase, partial [Planctomycetaceae bacterium]|nr:molybdopterin-dependent oxidoreductase [Planctomycetaceae bacterium]
MSTSDLTIHQSVCPLDCPDTCSLEVTVQGGRVLKVDGSRLNRVTDGYICGKVRHFPELVHGAERVLQPAIRIGPKGKGEFRAATWDEALARIVAEVAGARERFGGESILPLNYGGSNGYLTHNSVDARFFFRLGASRLARTLCAAPSSAAATGLYGKMPGVAYEDYPEAQLIVVWGANPSATGIHLVPYIHEAQRRGARLVVVDPRRTPLARKADLHLAVRPGADLPVALALIDWLFAHGAADEAFLAAHVTQVDELRARAALWPIPRAAAVAGLPAEQLEQLARWYSESTPALIRCGWGLERNRNGGSAVAAVLALPAVAGKFGVRGGGYTMSNSPAWDLDAGRGANEPESTTRRINMNQVGEALLSAQAPPLKCLFVYNSNPLVTLPEQEKVRRGLEREDLFTVVHEQVLTDTARYADVLLPATTFLEHAELKRGYGAYFIQVSQPAIPPVGEARPNYWLFAELCRRQGLNRAGDPETVEELVTSIVGSSSDAARLQSELTRTGHSLPQCGTQPVQFVDVFPKTADGKIHLVPAALDREAPQGLYGFQELAESDRYPLALISPASSRAITSTLYQLQREPAAVEIHPDDARPRSIASGDKVRVFNGSGEVRCLAQVSDAVRPGVAMLPKGLWCFHTQNGNTSNALAP